MSAEDLAHLGTDELIQRFVTTAKATPTIYSNNLTPESAKRTPERLARVAQMRALATELLKRNPIDDFRRLFEADDPDVRGWAGWQFLLADPEWASATLSGLCVGLTTRETLDLTRRARQRPPRHPAIKDMSDDALVERFEDAATREYATHFIDYASDRRDMAILNRIMDEVWAVIQELKARGAAARLLPFLDHRFNTVRREAADACLSVEPDRAQAVLEAIVAGSDLWESSHAATTLDKWRGAGPLGRPGGAA
jgi:hypothetical protein